MTLYETKVREVIKETSDCYSVKLDIPDGFTWKAGQYTMWKFVDYQIADGDKPARVFSLAAAPEDGYIMFSTRIAETHTSWKDIVMTQLKPGDRMLVAKANGSFDFHMGMKKSFALAGGIGITPIRSLIKHYSENNVDDHEFTIIYSDDRGEFCYTEDFKEIQEKMPNLKLHLVSDRDKMNKLMEDYVKENGNTSEYLIAGSPGMNAAITGVLEGLGVNEDNIKTDNFMGY